MSTFSAVSSSVLEQLAVIVGQDALSTSGADLDLHSHDQSFHEHCRAEVVVWCQSAEQVAAVLRLANQERIAVTPWGVGSSLEGNPIPLHGGILLNMQKMDRVIAVHAADFQVTVQPGKPYKDLNRDLAQYGLFFPPDPGANATIGGMLANNAAGIRTVKYGASKDNVLALQIALADGRLIRTGSRSIKQSAGYNLTQLFVGSEGTLGVITEATLRLHPIASYTTTMIATFQHVEQAVEAVIAVKGSGVDVGALEFLDVTAAQSLTARGIQIDPNPLLLMEVHNAHAEAQEADVAIMRELCHECGALQFIAFTDRTQAAQIWDARHRSYETLVHLFPQMRFVVMDVAVPISAFPQLVSFAREQLFENGIMGFLIGHAGDGNVHITLPYKDEDSLAQIKRLNAEIIQRTLELGGTATGEHGVGIGKARFMRAEHGEGLMLMREIKQTLDPNGIMNPGKIFVE